MPEMTCRSSLRSGPAWWRGMNGSITAHCASESQNRSVIAASMLQTAAVNHKTKAPAIAWFGSDPSIGREGGPDRMPDAQQAIVPQQEPLQAPRQQPAPASSAWTEAAGLTATVCRATTAQGLAGS